LIIISLHLDPVYIVFNWIINLFTLYAFEMKKLFSGKYLEAYDTFVAINVSQTRKQALYFKWEKRIR